MPASSSTVQAVYAVVGQDRFLRQEALERILAAVGSRMDSLGPARLDGGNSTLADILDEVRTPSLLGGLRIVIVDDADDCISAHRSAWEKYCEEPASGACLILLCDSMPRTTRLRKIISNRGEVIECEALKGRALTSWIARRARDSYGKSLNPNTAHMLREHLGDSLGALDTELSKLAAYVGDRAEITPQDIDAATGEHREEKVFVILDAIFDGDAVGALRAWEQVWATDRAAPGRAIGGLASSVRRFLEARLELDRGGDLAPYAQRLFTDVSALRRRLERTSAKQLREQQRDLLTADLAAKTGLGTVEVAVERFIVKHSSRAFVARSKAG